MTQQFEPFQKILVRDNDDQEWHCGFFSHIRENKFFKYAATEGVWTQCLPYEGNEHLTGTSNSPTQPEPEFKFGDKVEVWNFRGQCFKAVYCQRLSGGKQTPPHEVLRKGARTTDPWKHCRKADW